MTAPFFDLSNIDIRTFKNIDEIRDVDGFIENHPISLTSYAKIVGDYNFEEEIRCCFQKENGNLCGEGHKRGWVARLKDGTATIIGNHCAEDKFGADSRLISDRSRYINEKNRRARVASLVQLLEQKEQRLGRLAELLKTIRALQSRIQGTANQFGSHVHRRIRDMIRTKRTEVAVRAVKIREDNDAAGRRKTERSEFTQVLGTLNALELAAVGTFSAFHDSINDIVRAYQKAQELTAAAELSKRSREVDTVAGKLQQFDSVVQEADRLLAMEAQFFNNNFLLFCFLSDDREEKYKAAKIALRQAGKSGQTGNPMEWLAAQEKAIIAELKVDLIEIL